MKKGSGSGLGSPWEATVIEMAEPELPAFQSDASFNYRLPWDVLNSFSLYGVSAEEGVGNRPCLKGSREKRSPVAPHAAGRWELWAR